ncbi:MAG: subtilisin family serine protease [Verrucomicrobiales bacterium]|jgi:subtilisin family serine protease
MNVNRSTAVQGGAELSRGEKNSAVSEQQADDLPTGDRPPEMGKGEGFYSWFDRQKAERALAEGDGAGVKIAIIDSGVESSHPDLNGLILEDDLAIEVDGHRLVTVSGDGTDVFGHGTAIAGIVRNTSPAAKIGSFRVLGAGLRSRTAIIREGINQAILRGYDILNCSFGCRGETQWIMDYKSWVDQAYLNGIHVVAACNNQNFNRVEWPGYFNSVITVNMAPARDTASVYFRPGHLVGFAARGIDITVPWRAGTRKTVTGSSYAAPLVSALLARMIATCGSMSPPQAKAVLQELSDSWTLNLDAPNVLGHQSVE